MTDNRQVFRGLFPNLVREEQLDLPLGIREPVRVVRLGDLAEFAPQASDRGALDV